MYGPASLPTRSSPALPGLSALHSPSHPSTPMCCRSNLIRVTEPNSSNKQCPLSEKLSCTTPGASGYGLIPAQQPFLAQRTSVTCIRNGCSNGQFRAAQWLDDFRGSHLLVRPSGFQLLQEAPQSISPTEVSQYRIRDGWFRF